MQSHAYPQHFGPYTFELEAQARALQMQRLLSAAAIAAAVVLSGLPAGAATKHHRHHGYVSAPAAHAQTAQPEIACTKGGCIPVPPGCHAAMGRSPNGTPTSFDVAVCGDYTLYGNR
jgi:hypothetical protein